MFKRNFIYLNYLLQYVFVYFYLRLFYSSSQRVEQSVIQEDAEFLLSQRGERVWLFPTCAPCALQLDLLADLLKTHPHFWKSWTPPTSSLIQRPEDVSDRPPHGLVGLITASVYLNPVEAVTDGSDVGTRRLLRRLWVW